MKHIKGILCTAAIGLMLIVQLLQPASVFADGEGTPPPTSTPAVTETPQPTETVVETAMPSGTPENTVTPEETASPTDVPAVTPTPDPNEPTVEPVVTTPIATEFATPGTEEPTVEPVATTPAPTEVPTEEEDETKVTPTDTSTPTAEPVVSEDEVIVEEPSLGEVLSEIPAETEVVILNENGQPEPLATVEAAEAISSGGPVWCPTDQTPGGPGCTTATYNNLSDLVAKFVPTGNGTIYIASGNDSSTSAIEINGGVGGNWAAASNFSLTIQGGWSGATNSVFSVPISITNWNNDITIENITLSNVTATQGNGISISTGFTYNMERNDVSLKNVTVDNATLIQGSGIWISSGAGNVNLENITVENVTAAQGSGISIYALTAHLENITVEKTKGTGLVVEAAAGSIGATNIKSNNNQGDGANLSAGYTITLEGTNEFVNNQGNGLTASTGYEMELNNVIANDNGSNGVATYGATNLTMNNVIANDNGSNGVAAYWATNLTMNNVTANNNTSTGISISNADNISLTGGIITSNEVGLYVKCVKSLKFEVPMTNISGNTIQDISIDPSCPSPIIVTPTPVVTQFQGEFVLDCSKQAEFPVKLPNGDLVNIVCPVSGTARIYRLDNTGLPENLPEGYTYASAFTLDILQQGEPIPVITEGGYVRSSFVAQPLQPGNTYSVLYWDPWINENGELVENPAGGSWVPLKDFLLDGNGNITSFDLFPGTDDPRKLISGVNLVDRNGSESIEVSTNFPGIFVLAQH